MINPAIDRIPLNPRRGFLRKAPMQVGTVPHLQRASGTDMLASSKLTTDFFRFHTATPISLTKTNALYPRIGFFSAHRNSRGIKEPVITSMSFGNLAPDAVNTQLTNFLYSAGQATGDQNTVRQPIPLLSHGTPPIHLGYFDDPQKFSVATLYSPLDRTLVSYQSNLANFSGLIGMGVYGDLFEGVQWIRTCTNGNAKLETAGFTMRVDGSFVRKFIPDYLQSQPVSPIVKNWLVDFSARVFFNYPGSKDEVLHVYDDAYYVGEVSRTSKGFPSADYSVDKMGEMDRCTITSHRRHSQPKQKKPWPEIYEEPHFFASIDRRDNLEINHSFKPGGDFQEISATMGAFWQWYQLLD